MAQLKHFFGRPGLAWPRRMGGGLLGFCLGWGITLAQASEGTASHIGFVGLAEVVPVRADGILVSAGVAALLIGLGGVVWWLVHARHVRQLAEIHRAHQQQAELAQFNRASTLEQLTAALAHELNQPLAAILSNAQAARRFLNTGKMDTDELKAILDDIVRDDKRASGIIQNLRAMLGKASTTHEVCSLNEMVGDALKCVSEEMGKHQIVPRLLLASSQPQVHAARVEVQQVLMNLLLNAVQALRDVTPEDRVVEVETFAQEGEARVSIRDHGSGIPPERFGSLFKPFYTTKPSGSGLGMGLVTSRRLIEANEGRLEAANHPEGGAVFTFVLPLADRSNQPGPG